MDRKSKQKKTRVSERTESFVLVLSAGTGGGLDKNEEIVVNCDDQAKVYPPS
jgi:hypothetical protein